MSKLWKYLSFTLNLIMAQCQDISKPNIVFIVADDWGWNDVSFHGSDQIMTPNIDSLGLQGIILDQYYTDAFGTPSRSAMFTGKYPMRLGVQGISISASEDLGIPEMERLLPSYLRELGYDTCLIGKWNVGKSREDYLPIHRGFNTFYGFLDGAIDYLTYDLIENWNGHISYGSNMYSNAEPVTNTSGHITELFTDKAIQRQVVKLADSVEVIVIPLEHNFYVVAEIQSHNNTQPLYLHLSHAAPHFGGALVNLQTPADTITANSHIAHSARRMYAGLVTGLDNSVGRIVAALSEREMLQNTIIVIVSDNGALTTGALQNFGSNFPLRGVKGTPWEGALRSPALIWHPLLPSKIWKGLFHVTDWVPTLLNAAGDSSPKTLDGIDQWSAIKNGEKSKRKNALLTLENLDGWIAFREGDLKIIVGHVNSQTSGYYGNELQAVKKTPPLYEDLLLNCEVSRILQDQFGLSLDVDSIVEKRRDLNLSLSHTVRNKDICIPTKVKGCLFNISADPLENNNLWNIMPDKVNDLTFKLRTMWSEMTPRPEPKRDERADPSLHNYTWSPWLDNLAYKQQCTKFPPFPQSFSPKELQYIFNQNVGSFSEKLCRWIKNMGDSFINNLSSLFN